MNRHGIGSAIGVAALVGSGQPAAAETDIKFTLDWKFQGPTAAFFVAEDQGYFKEEGLEVGIDSGNGSAGAVTRVASGAYQMGFADINSLVEFNVANPGQGIKGGDDDLRAPPFGLYALKTSGITKPADLIGKKLGGPVFDASYKLFPAFAARSASIRRPCRASTWTRPCARRCWCAARSMRLGPLLQLDARYAVQGREEGGHRLHAVQGLRHGLLRQRGDAGGKFIEENPAAIAGFNRAVKRG